MSEENIERDYEFPYKPYDIQIQLMNKLYESYDLGKISIIESPTGTGKSLSIICSILKWLKDYKCKHQQNLITKIEELKKQNDKLNNENDDWISIQLKQMTNNNEIQDLNKQLDRLMKHIELIKELSKKRQWIKVNTENNLNLKRNNDNDDIDDVDDLIIKFDDDLTIDDDLNDIDDENYFQPKIYYCSRTHTQLSQFINEFKKTNYFKSNKSLMLTPLSSRINYCVNEKINHFNNLNMINEKCNDLSMLNKNKSCPYKIKMKEFGQEILSNIQNIEEIYTSGKQKKCCPYYTTKSIVPESEIIIMPYNIILNRSTRNFYNLKLKNSIVIIDEAHNLLETIQNIYSIELSMKQLQILLKYLSMYMAKYLTRFNTKNLKYLKQLIFIVKKFLNFLQLTKSNSCSLTPIELLIKLNIENINLYQLIKFIERSKISSKLHMFLSKRNDNDNTNDSKKMKTSKMIEFLNKFNKSDNSGKKEEINDNIDDDKYFNLNTMYLLKDFLLSLIDNQSDGKILIQINQQDYDQNSYKYLLLNSSEHFKEILQECRSVVLCGGTMKPFDDYINQLYRPLNIDQSRQLFYSCNHIINDDKLLVIGCGSSSLNNRIKLNYSFNKRNNDDIIRETGYLLIKLTESIPKGIVIFFPSYDYLELILKKWRQFNILKLFKNKKIFFEEKNSNIKVTTILNNYKNYLNRSIENSAILFSIIGGKMSEGINFSDDYGRAVIVIGLPYANRQSIELQEKINHFNRIKPDSGNDYYENLCMRSVNQSIGRAIRHQNDYATIILIDERYENFKIQSKLSDWIRTRFQYFKQCNDNVFEMIKKFFQNKI